VAKAKRAAALSELEDGPDTGLSLEPNEVRAILEARIRDPKTSARDLASLMSALARAQKEEAAASRSPIFYLRKGTLILEPGPSRERRFRLMLRVRGGIEHFSRTEYDLTAETALYLILSALGPELGLTLDQVLGLAESIPSRTRAVSAVRSVGARSTTAPCTPARASTRLVTAAHRADLVRSRPLTPLKIAHTPAHTQAALKTRNAFATVRMRS
jgi:hypothetical protein